MEDLGTSLIPLASFWILFNSLLKAAEFANSIRDAVLSGMKNNAVLSSNSRNALFNDWRLVIIGTILASTTYSAILFWMGQYIYYGYNRIYSVGIVIGLLGFIPLIGTLLFLICGLTDYKAMKNELQKSCLLQINSKAALKGDN